MRVRDWRFYEFPVWVSFFFFFFPFMRRGRGYFFFSRIHDEGGVHWFSRSSRLGIRSLVAGRSRIEGRSFHRNFIPINYSSTAERVCSMTSNS